MIHETIFTPAECASGGNYMYFEHTICSRIRKTWLKWHSRAFAEVETRRVWSEYEKLIEDSNIWYSSRYLRWHGRITVTKIRTELWLAAVRYVWKAGSTTSKAWLMVLYLPPISWPTPCWETTPRSRVTSHTIRSHQCREESDYMRTQ